MGRESGATDIEIKVQGLQGDNDLNPAVSPFPASQPPGLRRLPPPEHRPFRRWTPWLVPAFVLANLVVFAVIMYENDCPKTYMGDCVAVFLGRFAFQPLKENPLFGPSSSTLEKMGALDVRKVVHEHQGWRLISCIWLHAGVIHVLANMLSLLLIGIRLEQEFGFARIGLLYAISGFGGSLMSALFIKSSISVGASGALFGLLGGMLSELLTNWTIYTNKVILESCHLSEIYDAADTFWTWKIPINFLMLLTFFFLQCAALFTLVLIIAINLAVGVLPHVDNFAHIGGFVSGFLLGFVLLIRPHFGWVAQKNVPPGYLATPVKHKHKLYQYILWITAAILLIVGFTVGVLMLFRGVNANDYCSWCHYLSCVPTSIRSCSSSTISCLSSQEGNSLNLMCGGNRRARSYLLPNATEAQIEELCSQLCS